MAGRKGSGLDGPALDTLMGGRRPSGSRRLGDAPAAARRAPGCPAIAGTGAWVVGTGSLLDTTVGLHGVRRGKEGYGHGRTVG